MLASGTQFGSKQSIGREGMVYPIHYVPPGFLDGDRDRKAMREEGEGRGEGAKEEEEGRRNKEGRWLEKVRTFASVLRIAEREGEGERRLSLQRPHSLSPSLPLLFPSYASVRKWCNSSSGSGRGRAD